VPTNLDQNLICEKTKIDSGDKFCKKTLVPSPPPL
jgi:hypothetical protein